MQKRKAILGSAFFLVLAPGIVAGLIPWLITRWQMQAFWPVFGLVRLVGALWVLAALPVLLESFARFAIQGLGTPAPVAPTRHLVVTGFYRYVRNPMYVAVVSLVLAQGLLFNSVWLLGYGVVLAGVFHLFVLGYEEPTLRSQFGASYDHFRANVPRWLPRLRPWRPNGYR